MNWLQNMIIKLFKINPARTKQITIEEPQSFQTNVLKNKIWYRGDPVEIEQFFKAVASCDTERTRFWAAVPKGKIRKMHGGIVSTVIDRYRDIITADIDAIDFGEGEDEKGKDRSKPISGQWETMSKSIKFIKVIGEAIQEVLISGDGAFKVVTDEISEYPILEFYSADNVEYNTRYSQLVEIKYYTDYKKSEKSYRLQEIYGKGYINYKLFDESGKECNLSILDETKNLVDITFDGDFIMGAPLMFFESSKWKGRGKPLFDTKSDDIDALDEIISQWIDAIRKGRINRYIPDNLIPRDTSTGEPIEPNFFDNDFIAVGNLVDEDGKSKIDISQPVISYEAYVNSYASFLDIVLQGVISPSTLGIDLKKRDNAEAQREKEKVTLYVRNKMVDILTEVIPEVIIILLQSYDLMCGTIPKEYNPTIKFGEYASPDFDSVIETVSKASTTNIMSVEKVVDSLYGDTMSAKEKTEEVLRIKELRGIISMEEPEINTEGAEIDDVETGGVNLNGAQIQSLLKIVESVKSGLITRNAGITIVVSTLGVSRQDAEQFIEDNLDKVV